MFVLSEMYGRELVFGLSLKLYILVVGSLFGFGLQQMRKRVALDKVWIKIEYNSMRTVSFGCQCCFHAKV